MQFEYSIIIIPVRNNESNRDCYETSLFMAFLRHRSNIPQRPDIVLNLDITALYVVVIRILFLTR